MTSLPNLPVTKISKPVSTFRLISKGTGSISRFINEDELRTIKPVKDMVSRSYVHEQFYGTSPAQSYIISEHIVNDNFTHSRGYGRFNDDKEEVWYCAFRRNTAVKEKAYHEERKLKEMGKREHEHKVVCQEIFADFTGNFHDARGEPRGEGILGLDPETAYPLGQELAHKLRAEGPSGIIYPSVRDPGEEGVCLVAFHRGIVQNARYGDLWEMSWSKEGECEVKKM